MENKNKRNEKKKTYKEDWEKCVEGNKMADKLAKEVAMEEEKKYTIMKGTDNIIMIGKKEKVIKTNTYKYVKDMMAEEM